MQVVCAFIWLNRIIYFCFSAFFAIDIFDNRYGSDDYDVEVGNNFGLLAVVLWFSALEIVLQAARRKARWYIVGCIVATAHLLTFTAIACMEDYYHRLPRCSRTADCAWEPGTPYSDHNRPPRKAK